MKLHNDGTRTPESLGEMLDLVVEVMTSKYKKNPGLEQPAVCVLFKDGILQVPLESGPEIPIHGPQEEVLDRWRATMRVLTDVLESTHFALIMESWASRISAENLKPGGMGVPDVRPSEAPDRVECLIVVAGSREGQRLSKSFEIVRKNDGSFLCLRSQDFPMDTFMCRQDFWKSVEEQRAELEASMKASV